MKRSEINNIIEEIEEYLLKNNFYLPEWAHWNLSDWKKNNDRINIIARTNLGWDITDFGSGDITKRGLFLFTMRNGKPGNDFKIFAEKVLVIDEEQETPFHKHVYKKEDIINRGGGTLVIQLYNTVQGENRICDRSKVRVLIDSVPVEINAGESVELQPGQSIYLENHHYHRFYAKKSCGRVLAGEVSMVNDDEADNYFIDDSVGRFSRIDEDCEPNRLLVGDYKKFLQLV